MWPMKRQLRQASRSETRNRKSIKPNVDGLEDRKLLSFSAITYSLLAKATATVGARTFPAGKERLHPFPGKKPLDYNETAENKHSNGTIAKSVASMQATAESQNGANFQSGTISVSNDDLNNTSVNKTSVSSRSPDRFDIQLQRASSRFTFTDSGFLKWTWNDPLRTTPGSLGSIAIYKGGAQRVK